MVEACFIPGPAGRLEALAETPRDPPCAVAVICHPHPLYGGTLQNKVVHMLARTMRERGAATVRFNFRGVGRSEGRYDEGRGEREDARAVLAWARAWQPGVKACWLGGFSFGAWVAWRLACEERLDHLVTVAPAVTLFARRGTPDDCPVRARWLLVIGEEDEIVSPAAVLDWARRQPVPPRVETVPGSGHFFHGHLQALRDAVAPHLSCP
ncbi:MAG: alpha/beta hydrolase [Gammaproteobacteria bacterium]|nr:MAG: alpha/beta hydrolase [Gammaproteobacteria bacterium]